MAFSLGIGCAGINNVVLGEKFGPEKRCDRGFPRPTCLTVRDRSVRWRGSKGRLSTVVTMVTTETKSSMDLTAFERLDDEEGRRGRGATAVDTYERLDEWMRDSVVGIVKNLKEAPLLLQVVGKEESKNGGTLVLKKEKIAEERDWPIVKKKWETGENPLPEGLIFVEELGPLEAEERGADGFGDGGQSESSTTQAWGIVIQGKGIGCGPVCYLLKTSRVGAGGELDLCCTHFCLVRVTSFRETVNSQLKNCWLLQSQLNCENTAC